MALKLTQELKQTQRLSPLQIQTIKLIELPQQELEQRVRQEIESNPVLDESQPSQSEEEENAEPVQVSLSDYKEDDYIPSYRLYSGGQSVDTKPVMNNFSVQKSFSQSLEEQLGFKRLSEHERSVASFIIGSLDDDGYLRRDLDSVVDDIAFRAGIETDYDEVRRMLEVIQGFDPAGVGARDIRECLLLQLSRLTRTEAVEDATRIMEDCYEDFTAKRFSYITKKLSISQQRLKDAIARIVKLNPSPGGQIDDSYDERTQQIVPDFILETDETGSFNLSMPRYNLPELRINKRYAEILEDAGNNSSDRAKKEAAIFVKQKMDSAKWLVEAIRQRHNTLMKTMQAILDFQRDFFLSGDEADMKPMTLKDIAGETSFDISTISRVVNSKYIETEFGIYSLKYFFSEGLTNQDGEAVSTRELKKVLREAVDAEDKQNPLTDDELVKLLSSKGYKVARRTISKYRDQLSIPQARLRKELV